MKRSRSSSVARPPVVLAVILTLMVTVPGTPVLTHDDPAYSHDPITGAIYSDWMAGVSGVWLSELSIPGTHDSGAFVFGGDITETQTMDISAQLEAGIRMFDIRLGYHSYPGGLCPEPDLWVFHGIICQFRKFAPDVLTPMNDFLATHPGETVLMRIKQDEGSSTNFAARVLADLTTVASRMYTGTSDNPSLNDIRGKIVVFQNFGGDISSVTNPISWGAPDIQDNFNMGDNWDLADKWRNDVVPQLVDANDMSDDAEVIHINFLSASGGGFPYFFASGHSSHETDAPRLLTGWTRGVIDTCGNADQCIAEYPSVNCFLGTCSVAFEGLNILARDYITANIHNRTGIVMADFPGRSLISAIINVNPTNVPPTVTATGSSIGENGTATVSGTITDPDLGDTFSVTIDWGEGAPVAYVYPAGTTAFSEPHKYLDDNPTGTASDVYLVSVTVTDSDGGVGNAATSVTVNNVAPAASFDSVVDGRGNLIGPVPPNTLDVVLVGLDLSILVSFSDVGTLDTHVSTIDWGDGVTWTGPATSPLVSSHVFATAGLYRTEVSVTDDDTGAVTVERDIEVVTPAGAVQDAIEDLQAVLADPATDPATAALIAQALDELGGRNSSAAGNGALDHINGQSWDAALVKLRKAVELLQMAGQNSAASQLVLTAKAIVVDLINKAEATATTPRQLRAVSDAWDMIAQGDSSLTLVGAIDAYQQALVSIRSG